MYLTPERNRSLAEKLFKHVRESSTELAADIFEYDLSIYSDPQIAARERERIFERMPMMALHASQLPEPNCFVTVQLNRSNVLVTRKSDGSVGAFLNVCRHRGATVVGEESGKRNRFSCPYHGWTYANDGKLRGISYQETFGLAPCDERALVSLPAAERHGFIWIVEDPAGSVDVEDHLGPDMGKALAEYGLDRYHCYRQHVFEFPQNWKIMMDGLIDGYHTQFLHGSTLSPYAFNNMLGSDDIAGDHMLYASPRRAIEKIIQERPGDSPLDRYAIFANLLMPNSVMILHPHHIEFWTMYQSAGDVGACRAHLRYLTRTKEHDARSVDILEKNWNIATAAIINEDVPVGNSIQSSANMRRTGPIVLGANEIANQKFHRNYKRYMAKA